MENINWIRDLIINEEHAENSGLVTLNTDENTNELLKISTIDFLIQLKEDFLTSSSTYNQLRNSTSGYLKIYGISKTQADFMLFRNGLKLVFSMKAPGAIDIISSDFASDGFKTIYNLQAKVHPFGEIVWTCQDLPINQESLVQYCMTDFIKRSHRS